MLLTGMREGLVDAIAMILFAGFSFPFVVFGVRLGCHWGYRIGFPAAESHNSEPGRY